MRRKAKAIKPAPEMPNALLAEILMKFFVTEGGAVLRERYDFTEEQAVAWAIETMNRTQQRIHSEVGDGPV